MNTQFRPLDRQSSGESPETRAVCTSYTAHPSSHSLQCGPKSDHNIGCVMYTCMVKKHTHTHNVFPMCAVEVMEKGEK